MVKWVVKSLASLVLMFCASGYVLYLSTGQAPWTLLGHTSAGSFFASLLPVVEVNDAKVLVQKGVGSVESAVAQFVPSAEWGETVKAGESTDVYRWVDKAGVTHFSEKPPENEISEKVRLAPLVNVMPTQSVVVKPLEQKDVLKSLKEEIEQQEAEKARILNEL